MQAERLPSLERLLARADGPEDISDWRAGAFAVLAPPGAPMPGVAATALLADVGTASGGSIYLASPVHYLAEMSNVRLAADGVHSLTDAEAVTLALDFNRVWNDGEVRAVAGSAGRLFLVFERELIAMTRDPEAALDQHIENFLPAGGPDRGAARLRRLMSEIEMWLFGHALNSARQSLGQPAINGLWIWGGGARLESLPPVDGFATGTDVFFDAFCKQNPALSGNRVIVLDRPPDAAALEPSLDALRRGSIASIKLSVGSRCFSVSARAMRRFWRRRQPWWNFIR